MLYESSMAPPLRKARATLPAPADGAPLRLAVVADTHSRPHPDATRHLRAYAPAAILHAGDIGDREVLDGLAEIAPLLAIRGNIDVRSHDLPDVLTIAVEGAPALRILLVHIGVAGVKIRADVARMARAEKASLVVCGHSHIPFVGEDRGLTVFNPGSMGPRRFTLPIVFGTMEITAGGRTRFGHIDAETGRAWSPP